MAGDSTIRIEKFTGKNSFRLWQIKMKALLKQQQIWRPLASKSITAGSEDGLTDGQLVVIEEKAHSTILLSFDDHIITEVANQPTAVELWLKLESLCNKLKILNLNLPINFSEFSIQISNLLVIHFNSNIKL